MWHIEECDIRETTLETGADILGSIPTLAVFVGDICLINAVACCDFSSDPCQLLICHCGQVDCAGGGYVSFRRIGDAVAMIPAFAALASDDEFERGQYGPPEYLTNDDRAGAVLSPSVYATLQSRIPALPTISIMPPLTANEAITLIQMQAPLQVLGRFPAQPRLSHETILAVTDGDTETEIRVVNEFIQSANETTQPLIVASSAEYWSPIEFHLDGPGFPAWRDFVRFNDQIGILLHPLGTLVPQTSRPSAA